MNDSSRKWYLKVCEYLKGASEAEITLYPKPRDSRGTRDINVRLQLVNDIYTEFELIAGPYVIRLPFSMMEDLWNLSNVGLRLALKLKHTLWIGEDGLDIYLNPNK